MDGRDAMLAVAMNGEPLPLVHGFPVRMVVPGLYGYVSAMKWLVDLELSTFGAYDAYWVQRGWAQQAPIKTMSRIDTPSRLPRSVPIGRVPVAGVAWAQQVGIDRVEVRVDGGPWMEAELSGAGSIDTWRQWVVMWDATAGEHRLQVRADRAGRRHTAGGRRRALPGRRDRTLLGSLFASVERGGHGKREATWEEEESMRYVTKRWAMRRLCCSGSCWSPQRAATTGRRTAVGRGRPRPRRSAPYVRTFLQKAPGASRA